MHRRQFITTTTAAGLAAIAGCAGGSNTQGNDDNPIDTTPENLLPSTNLFGEEWTRDTDEVQGLHPVELDGVTAAAEYHSESGLTGVSTQATVFSSVDEAKAGYDEMREHDSTGAGAKELDIASESYRVKIGSISVYFRDANCIGMLNHVSDEVPSRSVEYSADWHETWRND